MRITADQKIAGYPAVQIRQLMRETVGRSITLRYVREILRCSDAPASRVLNCLQEDGFVEPVRGHLEPTTKGSALAMATAAPPLRRETAERLIAGLIERARSLNADERWAYRPNDVDIACELRPRWTHLQESNRLQFWPTGPFAHIAKPTPSDLASDLLLRSLSFTCPGCQPPARSSGRPASRQESLRHAVPGS